MKLRTNRIAASIALSVLGLSSTVLAEGEGTRPLYQGGYAAPMATYIIPGGDRLDDGFGGTLALGYRNGGWALELFGYQVGLDSSDGFDASPDLVGGGLNGLLFPFDSLPNLYGIATVGGAELDEYPIPGAANESFPLLRVGAGVGHLFPLSWGKYDFAIRAEGLYVAGIRDKDVENDPTIDAPRDFNDVVINVGLQLPFGFRADPPPPPPEPVAVVPVVSICSDGIDNDGDGLIDFPNDPGCSSPDDDDETDPPQCSDGKDNDGDGLIDFPNDPGCTSPDDNDETDPCKTPEPGERISLKGCGLGDVIVLRGVNFEFDQSRLTANARTILDNVAEELAAYPEIEVELSGHTDSRGSDEYNQRLSERRAAAVKDYLVEQGILEGRMSTLGLGESQPVAGNETDEGRELNRRTELKVTQGVAPAGPAVQAEAADPVAEAAAEVPAADATPAEEVPAEQAAP